MSLENHSLVENLLNGSNQSVHEIGEGTYVQPRFTGEMSNRYLDGDIVCVLEIGLRNAQGNKCAWHAVFHRCFEPVNLRGSGQWRSEFYLPKDDMRKGHLEQSVLIDVVEVAEHFKEVRIVRVPSVVRLEPLDETPGLGTNVDESSLGLRDELLWARADRELKAFNIRRRIGASVPNGESIDQMVEGRTQVLDAVPGDQRQPVERIGALDLDNELMVGSVNAGIFNEGVRAAVRPFGEFVLDRIKVFFGSTNF